MLNKIKLSTLPNNSSFFFYTTKVFFIYQNHPFQDSLVSKTYKFILVKNLHKIAMSANSSEEGGGWVKLFFDVLPKCSRRCSVLNCLQISTDVTHLVKYTVTSL